ncbi:MAG: hypothetical protein N3E37_04100 [Candidatus Micrarchaeota archaeon]|nr:hypothetical protein [Candidatus Micrarchaeota archaeon]
MANSKITMFFIITLLLSNSFLYSYWPFPSSKNVPLAESLIIIYGLGLLISIAVIAISYMLGTAFNLKSATAYAKTELVYFIYSIIIFLVLAGFDSIMTQIIYSLTSNHDIFTFVSGYLYDYRVKLINMYIHFEILEFTVGILSGINYAVSYAGMDFLAETVQCIINVLPKKFLPLIGKIEGVSGPLSGVTNYLPFQGAEISVSAAPAAGLEIITTMHTLYVDLIAYAYVAVIILKVIIDFINYVMWPLLIPLALALMVFPITRQVGTTVLAMCIVMYYVFPLTLVLGYEVYLRIDDVLHDKSHMTGISHILGFRFDEKTSPQIDDKVIAALNDSEASQYFKYLFGLESYNPQSQFSPEVSIRILEYNQRLLENVKSPPPTWAQKVKEGTVSFFSITFDTVKMLGRVMLVLVNAYEIHNAFALEIFHKLSVEAIYIMFAFFQLLMSVIICVSTYRDVSEALGGEIDLFGLLERF